MNKDLEDALDEMERNWMNADLAQLAIEVRRLSMVVERQGEALDELAKRDHDRSKMLGESVAQAFQRIKELEELALEGES